jgi:hypothetical protein
MKNRSFGFAQDDTTKCLAKGDIMERGKSDET